MRALYIILASTAVAIGVYAIPNLMELTLLNSRLSPWVSCVLLGDIVGCAILFLLGFGRVAFRIYLAASAFEGVLLLARVLPPQHLVWLTNVVPAIGVGVLLIKAGLRTLVAED